MEITLVRHAQPGWDGDSGAVDNPGLTPLGHEQARLAAASLQDQTFDAIYVSPLRRAQETAAPIAEAVGVAPQVESWLRELGLPSLQGQTNEQVQAYFNGARTRDLVQWFEGLPGGESFRHFHERVSGGLEGLLMNGHRLQIHEQAGHRLWNIPDDRRRLLFVSHEGTNSMLLAHLLGLEPLPWSWNHFSSAWAGITRLHLTPVAGAAVWSLESFNRVEHLQSLDSDAHGRSPAI